jgi:hypothetical protein
MVTFTRMPYAAAARRARIQDAIVYFSIGILLLLALLLVGRIAF